MVNLNPFTAKYLIEIASVIKNMVIQCSKHFVGNNEIKTNIMVMKRNKHYLAKITIKYELMILSPDDFSWQTKTISLGSKVFQY